MDVVVTLIRIVGSVGLFLYGMQLLSDGLQKSAGGKLRNFLELMTSTRLMAVLTGILITVIIQSSSATTVMVVSFVNAGLMNLTSAIGVIMGANIGTTVTGWIVALLGFKMDMTILSLFALAIALPLMFSKNTKLKELSQIFLGFGFLFFGLEYLKSSMPDIGAHPEILRVLETFNSGSLPSLLVCVLCGAVLTCIVQASAATMAITITMAYQGWIGVWSACALCLGQNIGTTITAYLASVGTSTNAKRAATAHFLFNVVGSLIALLLFHPMINLINALTPGDVFTFTGEELRLALPTFLAMFHTLFNVINTVLFFPLVNQFAALIVRLVPERASYADDSYHFRYIASSRIETPEFYLLAIEEEVSKMGRLADAMFGDYEGMYKADGDVSSAVSGLKRMEEYTDQMQEQLINFSVKILQDSKNPTYASTLNSIIRIIDETESITDSIYNLAKLAESRIENGLSYSEEDIKDLDDYNEVTSEFLRFITETLGHPMSASAMLEAQDMERTMNDIHTAMTAKIRLRISTGGAEVRTELLMLEVIRNLEHIGDYCINIAEASYKTLRHTPELTKKA